MGKRGEGAAEGDKVSSRPLLLFTDSSQPTAHYRSSCSLPLCYGTLASLFYFSLFSHSCNSPLSTFTRLAGPRRRKKPRTKSQERNQSKASRKGPVQLPVAILPLPFALYSTLHTLRPKPILAHIPHRLLCFHPLNTAHTRTHIQLQTIKVKHLKVSKHGRGPSPPQPTYLKHPSVSFSLPLPLLSSLPAFTPPPS